MKFGVIGLGKIGYGNRIKTNSSHFANYINNKNYSLEFLVERNVSKYLFLKKKFKNKVYKNIKYLNEKNKVDILSICVPPEQSLNTIKTLNKKKLIPKYLILEKPISNKLDEIIQIKKILKNKIVFINLQRIFDKNFLNLVEKNYKSLILSYNGGLINNGIHALSLLIYLHGYPKKIEKINSNLNNTKNKDTSYSFLLKFKNFEAVFLGYDNLKFNKFDFEFIGRNNVLLLRTGGTKNIIEKITKYPGLQNYKINVPKSIKKFRNINGLKYILKSISSGKFIYYNYINLMYESHKIIKKLKNV